MSNDGRYNGWSNYETWRVNLELFDGFDPDDEWMTGDKLEAMADEWTEGQTTDGSFASGILGTFLSAVNWQEIADHINEDYSIPDPDHVDAEEAEEV